MDPLAKDLFFYITLVLYIATGVGALQMLGLILVFFQGRQTHHLVNSQWDEWKRHQRELTASFGATERAAGVREGRDQLSEKEERIAERNKDGRG